MPDIDYTIVRRPRRKTLCISIRADNKVEVLAPAHMPAARISAFVQSKAGWIEKKQHFNSHIRTPHREKAFVSGEQFPLLGTDYTLHLEAAPRAGCTHSNGQLLIRHRDIENSSKTASLIETWYKQQATEVLTDLCRQYASHIGVEARSVGIKNYRSRWGTCHQDGRIYFNWRIVMAPKHVAAYVAVHEMCHLIHHNHSRAFWQLVQSIMPDYREAETWLKIHGVSLKIL